MEFSHTLSIGDRFMDKNAMTSPRLTRETVLRGALDMLNEAGIDGLSTRRLAEKLGVQSPTLYWHFKSKAELMAAMAEAIMFECHPNSLPAEGIPWQDWLLANSVSFRQALLAYRDGARLHAGTRPRQGHFGAIEAQVTLLCNAGFSPEDAVALLMMLGRFVVGWVLEEQQTEEPDTQPEADENHYPLMVQGCRLLQAKNPDDVFEHSIRMIIIGAERQRDK